ncbi:hypothetical protein TNCV_3846361 [Trichonephila clavipes]|nr:hypothetical protein TNCV_3846361 [Trichonephila clavipes]
MFDPSSFADPTPLAHADTARDALPRGGTSQPSEVIVLESTVNLLVKIQQLLLNPDLRNLPSFKPFAYLEPADFSHVFLEQEASKEKGAFIQAVWTVIVMPRVHNLLNMAWTEHGPQTLPSGYNLLK